MIFEIAHQIGLIPLLWLAFLTFRGKAVGIEWWWLAGVFAVSWLADTAAHWGNSWAVGLLYPVSQAAIVGLVFLSRRDALYLIIALGGVGLLDVFGFGFEIPDILVRTVAWLSITGIVWRLPQLERLRTSLLVTFGAGWLCWMGYAINPGWFSWSGYQFTRLLGILLFCWAATSPLPRLKISA